MLAYDPSMGEMKKITVEVPVKTLEQAQGYSGAGLAETVRRALADYTQREAQKRLLALKGKVKFDYTYEQIKAERE